MNRLISRNLEGVTPDRLPPVKREGPARLLFINSNNLGFATQVRQLKRYTAERADIDAVHVDLAHPTWMRVMGKNLPLGRGWDLGAIRYLWMYRGVLRKWLMGPLALGRFDVVHVTTQGVAGVVPELKGRAGVKWSVFADSTARAEVREFGDSATAKGIVARAEQKIFQAADLVACMSEWAARSVREDYGVAAERVVVAPGCPELPAELPAERPPNQLPRLLFVGNDFKRKGGAELLRVFGERFGGRARLDIVSAAPRPGGLPAGVTWHGPVEHGLLTGGLMRTCDLFVLPTRVDMSPWVVLEAAAAGLPVVATRVGAIPEMVRDGVTGLLVERGDEAGLAGAIGRMIDDAGLRRAMGQAAYRHVAEHYDPRRVYNRLLDRLVALADGSAKADNQS